MLKLERIAQILNPNRFDFYKQWEDIMDNP